MRGTKAKKLRSFARKRTVGKKDVEYRDRGTNKTTTIINQDGTYTVVPVRRITTYMTHDCTRKYYQLLKKAL